MHFHILTLGCPKNEVDSDRIARLLTENGHVSVDKKKDADVLIVNTCGFIDTAKQESIETILKAAAGKRPEQKLIAAGCLAQRYPTDLARDIPEIDAIVGTRELEKILEFVGKGDITSADGKADLPPLSSPSAYLKIADGCSATCGFCAIPMIKGPYVSRPESEIIDEAKELVSRGAKELILIAQDTTAYGIERGARDGLADLIDKLLTNVPELPWLRIMYAYPTHLSDGVIDLMAEKPQICHYIDLPLQHAHPATLRRMRRPGDMDRIKRLISRLRQAMPDISIRTSFIVGYPGETEEEFRTLLEFVQEMQFDRVGVFTYSQEEGTYAADLPDQIPTRIKKKRYSELMKLQQSVSVAKNRQMVGKEITVLVENEGDKSKKPTPKLTSRSNSEKVSVGRSYRDAPEVDGLVFVKGDFSGIEMVKARITGALEYDLIGELIKR